MKLGSYVISLHQLKGPLSPRTFSFKKLPISIGRSNCNINLDHDEICSEHAEIIETDRKFVIKDTKNQKGLKLNSQSGSEFELKSGDMISLGPFDFKFEWEELIFSQNVLEEKLKTRCTPGTPESVIEEVFLEELEQT